MDFRLHDHFLLNLDGLKSGSIPDPAFSPMPSSYPSSISHHLLLANHLDLCTGLLICSFFGRWVRMIIYVALDSDKGRAGGSWATRNHNP